MKVYVLYYSTNESFSTRLIIEREAADSSLLAVAKTIADLMADTHVEDALKDEHKLEVYADSIFMGLMVNYRGYPEFEWNTDIIP